MLGASQKYFFTKVLSQTFFPKHPSDWVQICEFFSFREFRVSRYLWLKPIFKTQETHRFPLDMDVTGLWWQFAVRFSSKYFPLNWLKLSLQKNRMDFFLSLRRRNKKFYLSTKIEAKHPATLALASLPLFLCAGGFQYNSKINFIGSFCLIAHGSPMACLFRFHPWLMFASIETISSQTPHDQKLLSTNNNNFCIPFFSARGAPRTLVAPDKTNNKIRQW